MSEPSPARGSSSSSTKAPLALPPRPTPNPSPPKPANSASASSSTGPALLSRISHALPARPTFTSSLPSLSRPKRDLDSSSPPPRSRDRERDGDSYIANRSPPRHDVYIASPSPPRHWDSYVAPRSRSRSRTPPRYRRPLSPAPRSRYDDDRDSGRGRGRGYHTRSPTPPRRRSPGPSRPRSPVSSRSPRKTSIGTRDSPAGDPPARESFQTSKYVRDKAREEQVARAKAKQEEFAEQRRLRDEERKTDEEARAQALAEKKRIKAEAYEERRKEKQAEWERIKADEAASRGYHSYKRPADEEAPGQSSSKTARIPAGPRIPTGPRVSLSPTASSSISTSVPLGPRADRPIPTGPKPKSSPPISPTASTSALPPSAPPRRSPSPSGSENSDMPPRGRGRGRTPNGATSNGAARGRSPAAASSSRIKQLEGPMMTHSLITETHGKGVLLKPQWADNPKAPLANYLGGGTGGAVDGDRVYQVEEMVMGKQKVFHVTVVVDEERSIIGVGDHANKKEAEKLAALSAVLQLSTAGLLDKGKPPKGGSTPIPVPPPSSGEAAKLSDGSSITYDRARQFMEYYCQRYKFGKPDIEFSQTSSKGGKKGKAGNMVWDAVITVGGRKIGMGSAQNKKGAQVKCYLDVTQYLESCDPDLWRDFLDFSKKDPSTNLGLAPHLVFQMSDGLNDDIQGLCTDIRHSTLFRSAPSTGVTHEPQPLPTWHSGRSSLLTPEELQRKSMQLQDQLADYHSDPRMERMRAQRESLPVSTRATDILAKIEVNDVTIVMAATGSGKTTQIPQLLFDDYINRGEGAKCNIICTQPRRLAAMSVAERIADERGQLLGRQVGYQVRFDAKLPEPNGSITFCTTGIFLKRMQSALGGSADPAAVKGMDSITHIVVDEVHERDIDTDLSLVVLKRLLADRKARKIPLKIVLMSATIDPTLFQRYFIDAKGRPAPVAEVPGRTFPVERHYLDDIYPELSRGISHRDGGWVFDDKKVAEYLSRELARDKSLFSPMTGIDLEIPYPLVALTIAYVLKQSSDGHVLCFLSGWEEIKKTADILLDAPLLGLHFRDVSKFSIHYLHSTIPAAEQREVFKPPPPGVRRIILATNIAETSVTIPDVVYVVDAARVKEKRYDPDRHMSSLISAWVGSSNLNQRAGRAGRHREGEYFGLLSKNRLESLDPHQLVEMKRSDLSNVVMHVKALNLGEVEDVLAATIEPPEPSRIVAALSVLRQLGALDLHKNLTSLGRVLLQLPVEAAIGKLCLYGSFFRCLDSALTLAAVLTNRDPFLAPIALKKEADEIKDSWSPSAFRSDPLAIVAAYNAWSAMDDRGDYHSGTKFCSDNFLSKPTMLQIKQVKGSLLQSLDQAGVIAVSAGGNIGRIGRMGRVPPGLNEHGNSLSLLAALIATASAPNFALRTSDKTCRTSQDKVVFIHASSVNSRRRETGGPEEPSASFNPAEKRLYAFGEKARNVPPGGNPNSALTQLRNVTRLDPMTYMLFGAYELVVTQRGLECDSWLPVVGNLHALDDVQRLKTLLDGCMLRVFEGVGKSLVKGRDARWKGAQAEVDVSKGSSRIKETYGDGAEDEGENESDEEGEVAGSGAAPAERKVAGPLTTDEIKELEMLTTDVVRVLDAYAAEREGGSTYASRPGTPGPYGHGGGVYRPPQAQTRKW